MVVGSPHTPASVALRRGERAIVIDLSSEAFGVGGWRLWEILRRFGKFWECLGEKSLPPFAAFAGGSVLAAGAAFCRLCGPGVYCCYFRRKRAANMESLSDIAPEIFSIPSVILPVSGSANGSSSNSA